MCFLQHHTQIHQQAAIAVTTDIGRHASSYDLHDGSSHLCWLSLCKDVHASQQPCTKMGSSSLSVSAGTILAKAKADTVTACIKLLPIYAVTASARALVTKDGAM